MKNIISLVYLLLFLGCLPLCAADALGTSDAELAVLKGLNKSGKPVAQSDKELSTMIVGNWTTGRHDYIFRKDGTWEMLPVTKGGTGGKWHVKDGRLFDGVTDGRLFLRAGHNLLVLRNEKGVYPFRYVRIK